jgi:hypothetical protein
MREDQPNRVVGIGWYRREQWALLKAESADAAALEDTYEEWLQGAERIVRDLASHGVTAERVDIDVTSLVAWCHEHGRRVDGAARADFVTRQLRDEHEHSSDETA